MIDLLKFNNILDAEIHMDILEQKGVVCFLKNTSASYVTSARLSKYPVTLCVDERDEEKARQILTQQERPTEEPTDEVDFSEDYDPKTELNKKKLSRPAVIALILIFIVGFIVLAVMISSGL